MEGKVYSVNPNTVFMGGGPAGRYNAIPPKPLEEYGVTPIGDFVENVPVPGTNTGEGYQYDKRVTTGEEIAKDLADHEGDLGLFVAAGPTPTKEEVKAARAKMIAHFERQYTITDALWERTHDRRNIGGVALMAARYLSSIGRLPEIPAWAEHSVQTDMMKCKFCGDTIRVGALKCKHCGEVLDQTAYAAARQTKNLSAIVDAARS